MSRTISVVITLTEEQYEQVKEHAEQLDYSPESLLSNELSNKVFDILGEDFEIKSTDTKGE